jgi:hypothetical protein
MYQRAMNLIFHDLLGIIMEVYIDNVVIKLAGFGNHIADLRLAFHRMKKYNLRMNPLMCAVGVLAVMFLGFIVHEHGIEVDPKKIEAIRKVEEQTCKRGAQSLLRNINYLQRFISNLAGRVESLLPLVRLKHEVGSVLGVEQKQAFKRIKEYPVSPPVLRAPVAGKPFRVYIAVQC